MQERVRRFTSLRNELSQKSARCLELQQKLLWYLRLASWRSKTHSKDTGKAMPSAMRSRLPFSASRDTSFAREIHLSQQPRRVSLSPDSPLLQVGAELLKGGC